jgi:hypothetical protein
MDNKFNEQKDTLIAIKKEINLLHQQVDYLIRNEKPLELLDLDVMMNRTHTIYDLMCGVNVNSEDSGTEDEELPVGLDTIREMFGIEEKAEEGDLEEPEEHEEQEGLALDEEEKEEENEGAYFIEETEDVDDEEKTETVSEETIETTKTETMDEGITEASEEEKKETADEGITEATEEEMTETEEETKGTTDEGILEDRGFILNFEPMENPVEETTKAGEDASVYTTGDEIEMSIPHLDFPEETIETREEDEAVDREKNEVEEEITYEPVVIGDMEEKEDGGFELETPETLGERLQQGQDPTLADKLQHSVLNSLQSAIGINDKFLFVNELFNGSMEKYNRSIANLDDLKTLNGALIYLNELRIELQWNSSNEAYKKLLELVHRKFGA